ncbi:MAG: M23 family metallopeptidase, partial [Lachnospiraceae bacterium]|nr:M23 family metallopeptidase [Lachnospiraceae bacterium]
ATAPGEKGSASAGMTTYRRASSSQKAGSISKGDIVYKLATSGSYVQVLYNIGSVSNPSGWRMAWVTKDNFNKYVKISQTTNNSDVAGMTDVTAYFAGKTITLQSVQNGKYICADKDYSNTPIFCNRNTASTWENFQVSSLTSDGWVGFKALANNKYLSASNNITDTPVRACADKILQWECHRIYLKGNDFYIKAQVNNKWLCVRIDKTNAPLEAYGSKPLEWERLNIRFKEQGQYVSAAEIIKKAIENTSDSTVQSKASSWEYPMKNTFVCGNNWRTYYSKSSSRPYHVGIDIASKNGNSNVYAAANGTVVKTGYNSSNGYYVIIKHTLNSRTVYSFYAHLKASSTVVKQGQVIEKGQKIAVFGNTGSSSAGAHLHFAITDKLLQNGGYYGYVTKVNGDKATYNGVTYFNPHYVVKNDKLP